MDDTETKILKLKNEFKDQIYNNTEIKNFSVKINLIEDAKIIQQKGRSTPIYLQDQEAEEIKETNKRRLCGKSHGNNRRLFHKPSSDHGEERQVSDYRIRFKKIE